MTKLANGADGRQGIDLSSLAVISVVGFLVGYMLSGTIVGERITNACFGDVPGLTAGDAATSASCYTVLAESFDSRSLADNIAGLAQTTLFATPEKLELTNAVLQALTGNPYKRQVHNENLSYAVR